MRNFSLFLSCSLAVSPILAGKTPIEVGTVEWGRDFDAAIRESGRSGKPVLAFFQEVPGCGGCKKFGGEVMSHPMIVQAVQDEFLPVLIYNNRQGHDAELLERYGEPAWNYQVVRFLDGEGRDLIPRKDRVWTVEALAARMIRALESAGRPPPAYLSVAAFETDTERQQRVAFAQHCFWSGEVALGQLPGVITTEAGWLEGHEVTLVQYHEGLLTLETLIDEAAAAGVSDKIYAVGSSDGSYRKAEAKDQKRQIGESVFERLDLSPMQRTKVNAFVTVDMQRALDWLTPEQRRELTSLQAAPHETRRDPRSASPASSPADP